MKRTIKNIVSMFVLVLVVSLTWTTANAQDTEEVIVKSKGSREVLKQTIQGLGGIINQEYQNLNAVAATVPKNVIAVLDTVKEFKVVKDDFVPTPAPRDPKDDTGGVVPLEPSARLDMDENAIVKNATFLPDDYNFNNTLIRANAVQATGNLGQNTIIAVIDTGTANNSTVVPSLSGTVIGGQSFVPATRDPVRSATSTRNAPHGTWVGTMIAGHAAFLFPNTSCFARSVRMNAPNSILDGAPIGFPGSSIVPMIGVAPASKIYALKVFPSDGAGAPSSRVIAAMDRAITIKRNFLAGMPSVPVSGTGTEDDPFVFNSLDIQIVNMSLGGPTIFAGGELEDLLTTQMLAVGITPTISAGNEGPAGLSTASPATGRGSLSMAAANTPAHERILRDLPSAAQPTVCRLGRGLLYRPNNTIQTAYFSSRGPTADGRVGVDLITAGFANFTQGANGSFALVSGTSFAAPTAAGAAALLRRAVPNASATQIRNALIGGGNRRILGDSSTPFDQGRGYLDVSASLNLLRSGNVSDRIVNNEFSDQVKENLDEVGLETRKIEPGETIRSQARNLVPGQRREFIIEIPKNVGSVQIDLTSVAPELSPAQQNQFFGDDVIFSVHQAKTSAFGDYPIFTFFNSPASFTVDNPEPGFMRITFTGDWTNAGRVSAEFTMTATLKPTPSFQRDGTIADGEILTIPFNVQAGVNEAAFELTWKHDWSAYPTNDLDLILVDPAGKRNFAGATLNGRERAVVKNPMTGTWLILVNGFTVFGKIDNDEEEDGEKATKTDNFRVQVFLK